MHLRRKFRSRTAQCACFCLSLYIVVTVLWILRRGEDAQLVSRPEIAILHANSGTRGNGEGKKRALIDFPIHKSAYRAQTNYFHIWDCILWSVYQKYAQNRSELRAWIADPETAIFFRTPRIAEIDSLRTYLGERDRQRAHRFFRKFAQVLPYSEREHLDVVTYADQAQLRRAISKLDLARYALDDVFVALSRAQHSISISASPSVSASAGIECRFEPYMNSTAAGRLTVLACLDRVRATMKRLKAEAARLRRALAESKTECMAYEDMCREVYHDAEFLRVVKRLLHKQWSKKYGFRLDQPQSQIRPRSPSTPQESENGIRIRSEKNGPINVLIVQRARNSGRLVPNLAELYRHWRRKFRVRNRRVNVAFTDTFHELDIGAQMALFQKLDVLVIPHGAAETNLIGALFGPRPLHVVEICMPYAHCAECGLGMCGWFFGKLFAAHVVFHTYAFEFAGVACEQYCRACVRTGKAQRTAYFLRSLGALPNVTLAGIDPILEGILAELERGGAPETVDSRCLFRLRTISDHSSRYAKIIRKNTFTHVLTDKKQMRFKLRRNQTTIDLLDPLD